MPELSRAMHIVIDMQRLFAEHPDWTVKDIGRIRKEVTWLAEHKPGRTLWPRFIPAQKAEAAEGSWRKHYAQGPSAPLDGGGADYVDLLPEHRTLAGNAVRFDKTTFSAFSNSKLVDALNAA